MSSSRLNRSMAGAARRNGDCAADTATTLSLRVPMLLCGMMNPTPQSMNEWNTACFEKVSSALEGAFAASQIWQAALIRSTFQTPTPMGVTLDCIKVTNAALRPAQRRVKANASRLTAEQRRRLEA